MSLVLLISLCFVSGSHGRRVQNALGSESRAQDNSGESLKSLATYLLSINPSLNARFRAVHPAVSHVRTPMMSVKPQGSTQGVKAPRARSPVMSVGIAQSTMDLASNCLKEGCPVDMVSDLLTQLKAEKQSSPEITKTIKQLEEIIASEAPNKNEMESIVGDMLRTFTVLPEGPGLGYTGVPNKGGWSDKFYWPTPKSTIDLASNCLAKGCPVDMVTDLLEKLKAEENPNEEAVKAIGQLEELLAAEKPNKNELERFVGDLARTFTVLDEKEPLGYTGKAGKGAWSYKFKSWEIRKSTMDLASNCLAEGCPIDMVTDLVEKLKAEENPSEEALKAIVELEGLLAAEKPNKNELEKFVRDLTRTFTVLDDKEALGYTGEPNKGGWSDKFKSWPTRKSTVDLASNCLEEGCPVDMVTDLLEKLKAEENPSEGAVMAMAQLEKLLAAEKPNKNELEQIVGDMLRIFTVLDEKEPLGYTGKAGKGGYADKFFAAPRKATVDLASNCLKEGCPVDMVTDLLTQLKAEENPSPEAEKMIAQLEELMASPEPNKNEMEQLVQGVVNGLKASYVSPNELIDGMFGGKK